MAMIVVGVDESEPSLDALHWAVEEGTRRGWAVRAVMAWSYLDQRGDGPGSFRADYTAADAQEAVERAVGAAVPGADVEPVAINDLPAAALLGAAAEADLLVVGALGKGRFKGALLGSVSQQCVHHSPVPVVIVRGRDATGPVVVGVDGSDNSLRAMHWALDEARSRGSGLLILHGSPIDDVLADVLEGVDTDGISPLEKRHVEDAPDQALIDASTSASLVVVGSRGRGGFARLLLGSVSQTVANHATCPVVVVPHPGND